MENCIMRPYPKKDLKFTLLHARGFAAQDDVYNTTGCLTRVAANLTQALFALNETYFLRDKQVMQILARFPILPSNYVDQVNRNPVWCGAILMENARG